MKLFRNSARNRRKDNLETGALETGNGWHAREHERNDTRQRSLMQPAHMLILR